MTIELLQRLSMIAYILAAVFFVAAVILFFALKVPFLFGELTGATARKGVEAIRQQTLNGEQQANRAKKAKAERNKQRSSGANMSKASRGEETELLDTANKPSTAPLGQETTLLSQPPIGDVGETAVLFDPSATQSNAYDSGETELLYSPASPPAYAEVGTTEALRNEIVAPPYPADDGETTLLINGTDPTPVSTPADGNVTVDVEMGFLGSGELIE